MNTPSLFFAVEKMIPATPIDAVRHVSSAWLCLGYQHSIRVWPAFSQCICFGQRMHGSVERFLALPVYLFYWVIGISAGITLVLSYVNANHGNSFDNIFEFDPTAFKIYTHRYAIVFVAFISWIVRYHYLLRREKQKWIAILLERDKAIEIADHIGDALSRHTYVSQEFKYLLISDLTRLANATCNMMNAYTAADCHVSIKTLSETGIVQTATRSEAGATRRRDVDDHLKSFQYGENTAFSTILGDSGRKRRKKIHFVSNHLWLRWLCRCYKNRHKGWHREYSKTLVVPITLARSAEEITIDNTFGFVCADSKRGHFDASRILLAQTASSCISVIQKLSERPRTIGQ